MVGEWLELCIGPAFFLLRVVLSLELGGSSWLVLKSSGGWAGMSFGEGGGDGDHVVLLPLLEE